MKKGQPKRTNFEIRRIIAKRLKDLRASRPQEQVIDPTGLNLSQYEAMLRTPSLDSIFILCEFFGITLREFFDVEGFDIPTKK
ncbi:helix-turn-helix domain-containing protein [Alistipes timonensis]